MAYVQIPKDLSKVKTKLAFNLTRRQLIGFSVAALIGFPIYLKTRATLGNDVSMLLLILVTLPAFFITFYEKDGLTCEQYLKCIYLHKNYQPQTRVAKQEYLRMRKEVNNAVKKY